MCSRCGAVASQTDSIVFRRDDRPCYACTRCSHEWRPNGEPRMGKRRGCTPTRPVAVRREEIDASSAGRGQFTAETVGCRDPVSLLGPFAPLSSRSVSAADLGVVLFVAPRNRLDIELRLRLYTDEASDGSSRRLQSRPVYRRRCERHNYQRTDLTRIEAQPRRSANQRPLALDSIGATREDRRLASAAVARSLAVGPPCA